MTMDVRRHLVISNEGQSLFEFLLTFPVLIGLAVIMVRVNTAIQISIVDQQYARAQALFLTYNSPFYPELSKMPRNISQGMNQMVLGVSDNSDSSGAAGEEYSPNATVQKITKANASGGSNAAKQEPALRSMVRIRNTVTLCTPSLFVMANGPQAIVPFTGKPPAVQATGLNKLTDGVQFSICGSQMKYE